ncbi:putative dehydrodolichyl diphosphate synthase complex subunit Nus1 [Helianthus annuus]|uniref:ditrans,polycis-polyprenyl diphosphate synthase [(2E,6E)-farnesyldiphosphate specific] n=1 Tax=Helianthus annuus TaxID=4232 RepID=A0A251SI51_HELAN|nr:putative dehydrodolichyl diphosphate synthase complex subunit Nus1 [Helianthus annuus]KAJ0464196.1 putative dehydrodolichyl diphosphate synthase complex subunit Nus1 [Helianthus annuus]KAJ0468631.1 putative dehydrodolichyl diphosphate synthase complex subunit Nus1 [Helianthus annuus]KAJ0485770.1 putative dehydrodolichyl diphosphate synthase complex subunit Nus1 [Helianthus annuus]KAJ0656322.1 putative dehydrodolichyl diphosphate synthase complex subunit Nus1 [Helianthus annuus]
MQSSNIALFLLWHIIHLIINVLYIVREIFRTIESYLITNRYVKTYTNLNLDRVKYLGIVIDSDEARNTSQVVELLEWLSAIGLKKICLYDREGVLKKSKADFMERFGPLLGKKWMDFEFVSISDGKEAVAKAANVLFKKYYVDEEDSEKPFFTETHLTEALKTLGLLHMGPLKYKKFGLIMKAIHRFTMVKQNYGMWS